MHHEATKTCGGGRESPLLCRVNKGTTSQRQLLKAKGTCFVYALLEEGGAYEQRDGEGESAMTMVVRVIAASVAAYVHDAKVMTVQAAKQGSKQPDQTALIQLEQYEDAQLKTATFPMTDVAVDIFSLLFSLCMRPLLSCGGWHPSEIKMHAASRCSVRRLTAHAGGEQTSPSSVIAGVDPDPRGAIAVLHDDELYTCVDLPTEKTRSGRIRHSLSSLATNVSTSLEGTTASTFVERATGSFNASPGASVQQGIGVGICMGALAACGHSVSTLHPNEWRPAFGLPNASSEKGKGKESNIALAEELFPQSTHPTADSVTRRGGRADAALLAAFARLREAASRNEESNLLPTLYVSSFSAISVSVFSL